MLDKWKPPARAQDLNNDGWLDAIIGNFDTTNEIHLGGPNGFVSIGNSSIFTSLVAYTKKVVLADLDGGERWRCHICDALQRAAVC